MKPRVRGYRPGRLFALWFIPWRYRPDCPCGWSGDVPAEFFDRVFPVFDEHRQECRRSTAASTR
ncbi:hypothetical protein [Streptomyces omiyaensis]|uniref:Uncharacterized protein n=1 Tax=Streptomyces omiyaensis TaxID=68247 RepID=A0ABW7C5F2_9ACTN|nr:hypothetical protein [Streptomyces omiyaensis]GGY61897.1 hypothetical protein GCM10010363_49240 [Streptomyces omiyaensis]